MNKGLTLEEFTTNILELFGFNIDIISLYNSNDLEQVYNDIIIKINKHPELWNTYFKKYEKIS